MQRQVLRRAHLTVAITPPLRRDLLQLEPNARIIVAHDGIRAERFDKVADQFSARDLAGWPQDKFIVGYMGRLTTYNMTKGINTVIDAIARLPGRENFAIALVGGPDEIAAQYKAQWTALGLHESNFLYAGQVEAADVPRYLSAFDICVMPFPRQDHFTFYTSPLKLFEYMASGRALVASDLPSWADVLRHEDNALLYPPEEANGLAASIARLKDDSELRKRLGEQARQDAFEIYTWDARARRLLDAISAETLA